MRRFTLIVPFLVALAIAPSCTHTTPQTPAQVAFATKQYAAQIEGLLTAAGNAATSARDVVRALPLSAQQHADFETQFATLQRAADTAIAQVEAFSAGTAPSLVNVHAAVQQVAGLFTPFAGLVTGLQPGNASLKSALDTATAVLQTALSLTAPTGGAQ